MSGQGPDRMLRYRPQTALERLLDRLSRLPGYPGQVARRKLSRRYAPRAVADFEARLAAVGPGDVLVDLGANVGEFTERLAKTGATVHAWEPDPFAFQNLSRRCADWPNVILHNAAVGARAGRLRLGRSADFNKDPLVHTTSSSIYFNGSTAEGIEVDVVSFADAMARCGGRPKIVKMDIEGAEFGILEEIFRAPAAQNFDALYVETHERLDPSKIPLIDRLRAEAEAIPHPVINLYWP